MPSARTTLTEVSTALGFFDFPNLDWAVLCRPVIDGVAVGDWEQIDAELAAPRGRAVAESAFANGQHFRQHPDGLSGRLPRVVEWTGGRKPPGDQVIPADLRTDYVYLVSCKYLSKIVLNTAPARLFDSLLQPSAIHESSDWYDLVAESQHRAFALTAASHLGLGDLQLDRGLDARSRSALKRGFGRHTRLAGELAEAYGDLSETVSARSAIRWRASLHKAGRGAKEALLWRMLRLASGTYFVLGVGAGRDSLRLRVMTPWDWRQAFELRSFDIEPAAAGQPQVRWAAEVHDREAAADRVVEGHVEVRWSHGRFAGPPEAKVYLDTPHAEVPGYVPLT